MYEIFLARYRFDVPVVAGEPCSSYSPELNALFSLLGGGSFNGGIYRVLSRSAALDLNDLIGQTFPQYRAKINCFGIDWLGRVFAQHHDRLVEGLPGVLMFEPGTGEVLQIPCNIVSFHDEELIDYCEEALAEGFYSQWIESGGAAPSTTQCVGYKRPLFLGGSDEVENLELSDLDVYWYLAPS